MMNREKFLDRLSTTDNLSDSEKIEVCQFYLDNHLVFIYGFYMKSGIKINGGSSKSIEFAYQQLRKRIKEFENV